MSKWTNVTSKGIITHKVSKWVDVILLPLGSTAISLLEIRNKCISILSMNGFSICLRACMS